MHLRRVFAFLATLLVARPAVAVPFEVFIEVESEDDLYELLFTDQISERSFETLLFLLQTRVDLNQASRDELYLLPNLEFADVDRILAFRDDVGSIDTLDALVAEGVLPARLTRSIAPFVIVAPKKAGRDGVTGFVRAQSRWSGRYDRLPPATATQARVRAASHLDTGALLVLTRNSLRRVRWDPSRGGLSVEPESPQLVVPKAYVGWSTDRWQVVAGTYRIGFGQRLTFDVTQQQTPNGAFGDYEFRRLNDLTLRCKRSAGQLDRSPCPSRPLARVTPDFAWTHRLTGAAAGVRRADVGRGWLQAFAWGSFQPHRVQSRDLVVRSRCRDPRADDDPDCRAPSVYVRGGTTRLQSTARYASLRRVSGEPLAGMNIGYFWNARTNLMVTGYAATTVWLVRGVSLDYQEIAAKPFGGPFGAVGIAGAYGARRHDLLVEVTRSVDRQTGGGGGLAGLVRSVTDLRDGELELSVRAYGPKFANPYARPISAPDELDGLRARDEAGIRARWSHQLHPRVTARVLLDGWRRFRVGAPNVLGFARVDAELGTAWTGSVWAEYRSAGRRALLAARVAFEAVRDFRFSLQLQHRWHGARAGGGQQDVAGVFSIAARPADRLGLRFRLRYDLEDAFDNQRLPHTAWLFAECSVRTRSRDTLRVRYDLRAFLDERPSTEDRQPNPEHWLWLEYVFRY